jgi:hypothetical protein
VKLAGVMLLQDMQLAGRDFVALDSILFSMDAHVVGPGIAEFLQGLRMVRPLARAAGLTPGDIGHIVDRADHIKASIAARHVRAWGGNGRSNEEAAN